MRLPLQRIPNVLSPKGGLVEALTDQRRIHVPLFLSAVDERPGHADSQPEGTR